MNCFYILISSLPFTPLRPGVHVYTSLKLLWQRPAAIFLISKFNRFFFPVLLIVPKEVNNILEILPQPLVKTFSWFFFYLSDYYFAISSTAYPSDVSSTISLHPFSFHKYPLGWWQLLLSVQLSQISWCLTSCSRWTRNMGPIHNY